MRTIEPRRILYDRSDSRDDVALEPVGLQLAEVQPVLVARQVLAVPVPEVEDAPVEDRFGASGDVEPIQRLGPVPRGR